MLDNQTRGIFIRRMIYGGIAVAVLVLPVSFVVIQSRNKSAKNACINNLRLIDSCKKQWGLEQRKKATDIPMMQDLWFYDDSSPPRDGRGWMEAPSCPSDPSNSFRTSYQMRGVGEHPTCLIDPKNHVLP